MKRKVKKGDSSHMLLLKIETFLSFFLGFLLLSAKITGFAVENSEISGIAIAGSIFLVLGVLGLTTLTMSRNKIN